MKVTLKEIPHKKIMNRQKIRNLQCTGKISRVSQLETEKTENVLNIYTKDVHIYKRGIYTEEIIHLS